MSFACLDFVLIFFYVFCVGFICVFFGGIAHEQSKSVFLEDEKQSFFSVLSYSLVASLGCFFILGISEQIFLEPISFALFFAAFLFNQLITLFFIFPRLQMCRGNTVQELIEQLCGGRSAAFVAFFVIASCLCMLAGCLSSVAFLFQYLFYTSFEISLLLSAALIMIYQFIQNPRWLRWFEIFAMGVLIVLMPIAASIGLRSMGGGETLMYFAPMSQKSYTWCLSLFFVAVIPPLYAPYYLCIHRLRDPYFRNVIFTCGFFCVFFLILSGLLSMSALYAKPELQAYFSVFYMIENSLLSGFRGMAVCGFLSLILAYSKHVFKTLNQTADKILLNSEWIFVVLSLFFAWMTQSLIKQYIFLLHLWVPFMAPSLLLGILGKSFGSWGFYVGLLCGFSGWLVSFLYFDFMSYEPILIGFCANLISIVLLSSTTSHLIKKITVFDVKNKTNCFEDLEYDFFAFLCILFSSFLFLAWALFDVAYPFELQAIYCFINILCFTCFLREFWPKFLRDRFEFFGLFFFIFSSLFPSLYIILHYPNSILWLINLALGFLWLWLFLGGLTFTKTALISFFICILSALVLPGEPWHDQGFFFFWPGILMIVFLIISFLYIKNKNERAIFDIQTLTGTMAHSFHTPLAVFSLEAEILNQALPILIETYENSRQENPLIPVISSEKIKFLKDIPLRLRYQSSRLKTNVKALMFKMGGSGGLGMDFREESLLACVRLASQDFYALYPDIAKNIRWEVDGDFEFLGDQDLVVLMLTELFKNAFDSIKKQKKGHIEVQILPALRMLCIRDTASGIPPQQQANLFMARYTTKKGGSGLGLYFCKLVMQELKGTIEVHSDGESYVQFVLRFPKG